MSIIRRLTATLTARVDRLVGEIENHDAVVAAGIDDARRAYAQAKARHARLVQEGERLRGRRAELTAQARRWEGRALAPEVDEPTALECLRRRNQAEAQAAALGEALERQRAAQAQLDRALDAARERIGRLEHQRRLLHTRELTAGMGARLRSLEDPGRIDLDATFERWEARVTESELMQVDQPCDLPGEDPLTARFDAAEARQALCDQLAALRRERGVSDEN